MSAKQTKLDVLFPNKSIELSNGSTINLHPLSLEDLPNVVRVLVDILKKAKDVPKSDDDSGYRYVDLVVSAGEDAMKLLPYCSDKTPGEIPLVDAPDVIETILEQNLTEAALGKWTALLQKLAGKLGINLDKLVDQGKKSLKKDLPS